MDYFRARDCSRHEFSDGEAMVEAVPAGSGLSQLPTWLVGNHLASGALVAPSAFSFLTSATF